MTDYPRGPSHHGASEDCWADCIDTPCPRCAQPPGSKCRNLITKTVMHGPHYQRIQAAEKTAS